MSATEAPAAARREISVRAAALRLKTTERQVFRMLTTGLLTAIVEPGRNLKIDLASVEKRAKELGIPAPLIPRLPE